MKLISIAALVIALTATALPAQAAWQTEDQGDGYAVGWVYDTNDKVQLSVDCDAMMLGYSVALISDEKWDASHTYPKTVSVRVVIDGKIVTESVFEPENAGGNLGIAAYEWDRPEVYDMILAMGLAGDDIEVSFLDQSLHFTAENVLDAAATVTDACDY